MVICPATDDSTSASPTTPSRSADGACSTPPLRCPPGKGSRPINGAKRPWPALDRNQPSGSVQAGGGDPLRQTHHSNSHSIYGRSPSRPSACDELQRL